MNHGIHDAFAYLLDVGKDILFAAIDKATGTILAQVGNATDATADSDKAEIWGPPGLWSIPAAPTSGQSSCQAISIRRSDQDIIIATRDLRRSSIYGNLQAGETCVGANTGQAATTYKVDGSISHCTTDDNTPTGNLVMRRLTPAQESFWSPWGSQLHDQTGWHLRTWHGAKIDAGGLGLPAPFNSLGLSSSMLISADQVNIDAALLTLGRNTGTTGPVVQALQLQVIMTELGLALAAIGASIDGIAAVFATYTGTGVGVAAFPGLTPAFALLTTATDAAIVAASAGLALVGAPAPLGTATRTAIA